MKAEINILPPNANISSQEIDAYVQHVTAKHGRAPDRLQITVDGDEVELYAVFKNPPFERIRRITGYLVGSTDRWNNAKRAEEADRVKHGIGGDI